MVSLQTQVLLLREGRGVTFLLGVGGLYTVRFKVG